jgi:hypothetical protein
MVDTAVAARYLPLLHECWLLPVASGKRSSTAVVCTCLQHVGLHDCLLIFV